MSELQGRRTRPGMVVYTELRLYDDLAQPGDYALVDRGGQRELWFRDPLGMVGRCVTHTITENDDGTITVEPSIADEGEGSWHGWLRKGVWEW